MKAVVVGDAGLDVVARHEGPIVHGGDSRSRVRLAGGGAGANTALWLTASGVETTLIARIGDDAGGRLVRAELEAAGVSCAFAVDGSVPTCCVVVLVDGSGQRSMLPDRGANARFSPEDGSPAALAGVLAAWLGCESTVDVLRAGVRLGARAVTKVGAQP